MRIVYANTTTSVGHGGRIHRLTVGEAWDADDPIVVEHSALFSDLPVAVMTSGRGWVPVETATAAPGEKRNVKRG